MKLLIVNDEVISAKGLKAGIHQWLEISLASLQYFSSMKEVIDTSGLTVDQIAELIMSE